MPNKRTPQPLTPLARLRRMYAPSALCYHLGEILLVQQQPCAHDFAHTRAFFAHYAPDVDVDAYIGVLQELGAHCDCEIGHNVCTRIKGA